MCVHESYQRHYCWMYEEAECYHWHLEALSLPAFPLRDSFPYWRGLHRPQKWFCNAQWYRQNNPSRREPWLDQTVCNIWENIFAWGKVQRTCRVDLKMDVHKEGCGIMHSARGRKDPISTSVTGGTHVVLRTRCNLANSNINVKLIVRLSERKCCTVFPKRGTSSWKPVWVCLTTKVLNRTDEKNQTQWSLNELYVKSAAFFLHHHWRT